MPGVINQVTTGLGTDPGKGLMSLRTALEEHDRVFSKWRGEVIQALEALAIADSVFAEFYHACWLQFERTSRRNWRLSREKIERKALPKRKGLKWGPVASRKLKTRSRPIKRGRPKKPKPKKPARPRGRPPKPWKRKHKSKRPRGRPLKYHTGVRIGHHLVRYRRSKEHYVY
jgi:hypothetical protein